MRFKFRIEEFKKARISYPEISIDTHQYPMLQGLNTRELQHFLLNKLDELEATDPNFNNLKEQLIHHKKTFLEEMGNGQVNTQLFIEEEDEE